MLKKFFVLILMTLIFLTGCSTENKNEIKENKKIEEQNNLQKEPQPGPGPNKHYKDIDPGIIVDDVPNTDPNFTIDIDTSGIDDGMIINENCIEKEQIETIKVDMIKAYKPVIYLYPEKETKVNIALDIKGTLTSSYPTYEEHLNGWNVTAYPNGNLIDENDEKYNEYPYIFWEGDLDSTFDLSKGYVVRGSDTGRFLQMTLSDMGLNSREYADFITYWMPKIEKNPWNLITFQTKSYTDSAKLKITPEPDTLIRIFMVWKALEEPINIQEPDINELNLFPERKGFTVVEWGGTEIS